MTDSTAPAAAPSAPVESVAPSAPSDAPASASAALAAPTSNAPAPDATPPAAGLPWFEGADTDTVGYITNKGWQSPADILQAYRGAEKFISAPVDRRLVIPDVNADEITKNAFAEKLGRPKEAKAYEFTLGENNNGWDDALKESFFKHGIPADAAKGIMADYAAKSAADIKTQQDAAVAAVQTDHGKLQSEWGAAFAQNMEQARKGRAVLGWDDATVDSVSQALGHGKLMKTLQQIGARSGEAEFVDSGNKPSGYGNNMTPAQAKARRDELMTDPAWVKRYTSGGKAEAAELKRVIDFMHPGQ